jgi:nitrite reductase/ring-hydroxylating ferredoxin subunit
MWIETVSENEISEHGITRVYPAGVAVILIKKGGKLHALSASCPHMGCSLGGAIVEDGAIRCPCHDWRFDIATGGLLESPEIKLETFSHKTENGRVCINIERNNR